MKIQLISDVHLEVSDFIVPRTDADVIVLAGDIGARSTRDTFALISGVMKNAPDAHVIYVLGNHELYGWDINLFRKQMREKCGPASGYVFGDVASKFHFLDDDEVIINGVRFLGCTLWTDFLLFGSENRKECMIDAAQSLNDFRLIRNGEWNFSPADSVEIHNQSVKWLKSKLDEKFDGETVVVTHHAPSFESVADRYKDSFLSACFASRLDDLLDGQKVKLWCHGHMHDSLDYNVNGTRVVCNPRGYTRYEGGEENQKFNPALILEI